MRANLPLMSRLTALAALATSPALAQDPVKVDNNPSHYKVEVENDQVRVLHVRLGPKETSPMHYHPATVVIGQSDVRLRFTYPDGKTEERMTTAGSIRFRAAVTHTAENLSDKDFDAIEVELKPSPKSQ
jgi:quercetin dioxygenase-like cupin family protein